MDYKTYLDFVLALENRKEPQALAYCFRILGKYILHFYFIPGIYKILIYTKLPTIKNGNETNIGKKVR